MDRKIIEEVRLAAAQNRLRYSSDLLWEHCVGVKHKYKVESIVKQSKELDVTGLAYLQSLRNRSLREIKVLTSILNLLNQIEVESYVNPAKTRNLNLNHEKLSLVLLRLLDSMKKGGIAAFLLANKLRSLVETRTGKTGETYLNYRSFFEVNYDGLTPSEFGLHNAIRDYTENVRYHYYLRALRLILNYDDYGKDLPSYLALRKYLLFWVAKFESELMGRREIAVIEIEHNNPVFPVNIISELKKKRANLIKG